MPLWMWKHEKTNQLEGCPEQRNEILGHCTLISFENGPSMQATLGGSREWCPQRLPRFSDSSQTPLSTLSQPHTLRLQPCLPPDPSPIPPNHAPQPHMPAQRFTRRTLHMAPSDGSFFTWTWGLPILSIKPASPVLLSGYFADLLWGFLAHINVNTGGQHGNFLLSIFSVGCA